jgi:hypothetical protein
MCLMMVVTMLNGGLKSDTSCVRQEVVQRVVVKDRWLSQTANAPCAQK